MPLLNDLVSPFNGLVAGVLRSRFHGLASKGLMIVQWQGRKSGKTFEIPVGVQPDGEGLVVMLSKRDTKQWWRNFVEPWPATLWLRGEPRAATGVVVPPGTDRFFTHCETTLRRMPWMGSQFGGIPYDRERGLTEEQRKILCENVGAVAFTLEDETGAE